MSVFLLMSILRFRIQSKIPYCIILCFLKPLQSATVPNSFLFFHDFDTFEEYGLSCLVEYPSIWLSDFFFSSLHWGYTFGARMSQKGCPSQCILQGEQIEYVLLLVADVHVGHLNEVLSANVFHCEVTSFLFVINKYLWVGRYFVTMNYLSNFAYKWMDLAYIGYYWSIWLKLIFYLSHSFNFYLL